MFLSLLLAAAVSTPTIVAQAVSTPAPAPAPTPVQTTATAPPPVRPHITALAGGNGASIISTGVPLHILVAAIANRRHLAYRILPDTPDVPERFTSRTGDELLALSKLLAPDGLVSFVDNETLYVGTAPAMDATLHTNLTTTVFIPTNGIQPQQIIDRSGAFAPPGLVLIPDTINMGILARGTPDSIRQFQSALVGINSQAYVASEVHLQNGLDPVTAVKMLTTIVRPVAPNQIIPDPYNTAILLYGTDSFKAATLATLNYIDKPLWTVFYSISIYEVDPATYNLMRGIKIGQAQTSYQAVGTTAVSQQAAPNPGSIFFGFPIGPTLNINAQLDEAESTGHAKIVRRADVRAVNGVAATTDYLAHTGFTVPNQYTGISEPRTVQTGVNITVTPYVGANTLTSDVVFSISNITDIGPSGLPNTVSRDTKTTVISNFDDSIVISGLFSTDELQTRTGIPPLNKIPLIKNLTGHNQVNSDETELIAVLTPHLMRANDTRPNVMYPNIPQAVIDNGLQNPTNPAKPPVRPTPPPATTPGTNQ